MPKKLTDRSTEKINLHPRNKHRSRYDFRQLITSCAELQNYVFVNEYKSETIDFSDPQAVKMLNKALLKHFYDIDFWDIPNGYLCPPIPGRADYIHYMADLLSLYNDGIIPTGNHIHALDIGTGANCIYPIIGNREYGWTFTGSDIDVTALDAAFKNIQQNEILSNAIKCKQQTQASAIFNGIIAIDDIYDVTFCNPPFHASAEDAQAGSQRKVKNLGIKKNTTILNFGGRNNELWCDGGETAFISKMIEESAEIPLQCFWFSSLIAKKEHLPSIYYALKKVPVTEVRTINMAQGQKISRLVAWTFLTSEQQQEWKMNRWKA